MFDVRVLVFGLLAVRVLVLVVVKAILAHTLLFLPLVLDELLLELTIRLKSALLLS